MPFYHKQGKIPHKRHTTFKKPDGNLYYEQLFGTEGFHGMSSLLYHVHRPTMVKEILGAHDAMPNVAVEKNMKARRLKGFDVKAENDYLKSRKPIMVNNDLNIVLAAKRIHS